MAKKSPIDWPEGTIEITLDRDTGFCLDLWHKEGCSSHYDENGPGDRVQCNDEDNPECKAWWILGDTIHLVPIPFLGVAPNCTVMAEFVDWEKNAGEVPSPMDGLSSLLWDWAAEFKIYTKHGPSASCQWKGTVVTFDFTCTCGAECRIDGQGFVYSVMCPGCSVVYHCIDDISIEAA